jgi:hypothetical protein
MLINRKPLLWRLPQCRSPPALPPQGFLLKDLGYLEEPIAAIALDLMPPTLIEYRKAGIGPDYTVVGRTIFYSPTSLQKWLENGGTRAFEHGPTREAALAERPKIRKPKTAQRDAEAAPSTADTEGERLAPPRHLKHRKVPT